MAENLDICNIKMKDRLAPTPQNTPAGNSFSSIGVSKVPSGSSIPSLCVIKEDQDGPTSAQTVLSRNPGLVSMIQDKLGSLVGQSSGYIESLPAAVRRRIDGLQGLQTQHAKLEAAFHDEILQLEKKYNELYLPLYEKRSKIVNGVYEPTDAEVEMGREFGHVYETPDSPQDVSFKKQIYPEDVKGVPEFWLTAMKNVPSLAEIITPEDEKALCYLTDIRMSYLDKPGFRLEFYFADNDFFSNKMISKTYYYKNVLGYGGDFVYDHAEGDKIDWKANKDLTTRVEIKRQRNKNTKQTRVIKKVVPVDSFFRFFTPPEVLDDQDDDDSDIDNRLEADYQCGEDIKEKLIPRAIDWFTGVAMAYEDEYANDSDQDYTDDDGDEDDDDDDDEEDNDYDDNNRVQSRCTTKPNRDSTECRQS